MSESINYQLARFATSYGTVGQLPASTHPEVSFAGRSNVGKSSLLNKLFNRRALAKVSSKPGKTTTINFFEVDGVHFVDLPGYGYARVAQSEKERWADLIGGYYDQERSFNLVVSLIDVRHEAQKLDVQMVEFLKERELNFIVALTKADKLSHGKAVRQRDAIAKQLGLDRSRFVLTSSETGEGIDELKRRIAEACL